MKTAQQYTHKLVKNISDNFFYLLFAYSLFKSSIGIGHQPNKKNKCNSLIPCSTTEWYHFTFVAGVKIRKTIQSGH